MSTAFPTRRCRRRRKSRPVRCEYFENRIADLVERSRIGGCLYRRQVKDGHAAVGQIDGVDMRVAIQLVELPPRHWPPCR